MTKQLSRLAVQRMVGGRKGSGGGGGGGGGGASQGWVDNNYLSKAFFNQLFEAHVTTSAQEYDENDEPVGDPVITTGVVMTPNEVPTTTTETDTETDHTTVTTYTITDLQVKTGLWTNSFVSALGQGSGSGGGGATTLADLLDVDLSSPTNGQVLMYNATTQKWYNGTVQSGSSAWADITGKPTTLSGYGITDAHISNGTIYLGSNSITPLTSESDPTVPAWAKAATKPSYRFSELTNHPTTLAGYGITDAIGSGTTFWGQSVDSNNKVKGSISMDKNDIISFDSKNALQYDYANRLLTLGYGFRSTCPTQVYGTSIEFYIGSAEIVRITSSGLRIGDGLISWDSTNNALKISRISNNTEVAGNLYATGGISALGTT